MEDIKGIRAEGAPAARHFGIGTRDSPRLRRTFGCAEKGEFFLCVGTLYWITDDISEHAPSRGFG